MPPKIYQLKHSKKSRKKPTTHATEQDEDEDLNEITDLEHCKTLLREARRQITDLNARIEESEMPEDDQPSHQHESHQQTAKAIGKFLRDKLPFYNTSSASTSNTRDDIIDNYIADTPSD